MKIFINIFHGSCLLQNFHYDFFQNLFSHSRSRIFTRIEWWYSQAPNRSREEDTDDFRFPGLGRGLMHGGVKCDKLSRSRFFTRIEWWYSQAPNRPREEDTDDFRFLTFRSGKTPALSRLTSDFPDFRNLSISRQPLSNINKHLVFPSKPFAPPHRHLTPGLILRTIRLP